MNAFALLIFIFSEMNLFESKKPEPNALSLLTRTVFVFFRLRNSSSQKRTVSFHTWGGGEGTRWACDTVASPPLWLESVGMPAECEAVVGCESDPDCQGRANSSPVPPAEGDE